MTYPSFFHHEISSDKVSSQVAQQPLLFDTSIRNNLTYGCRRQELPLPPPSTEMVVLMVKRALLWLEQLMGGFLKWGKPHFVHGLLNYLKIKALDEFGASYFEKHPYLHG